MLLEGTCWLVEYVGAVPVPVYACSNPHRGACTTRVEEAMTFGSKESAEVWMQRPYDNPEAARFLEPWAAVEHSFGTIQDHLNRA